MLISVGFFSCCHEWWPLFNFWIFLLQMHHIMSSPKGPNISTSCNGITHICTLTLRIPNFHQQKFCQWLFWPFVECDHTLWPFPCLKMAPAWMLGSCVLVMGDLLSIYPLIHKMEMIAFSCRAHRTVVQFSSVQSLSHVRLFATPWPTAHQASLSITNSWSSLKPMSIESVMPSKQLILCCPFLLLNLSQH